MKKNFFLRIMFCFCILGFFFPNKAPTQDLSNENDNIWQPSVVNIYPFVSFGELITGTQKKEPDETLSPKPDSYDVLEFGIGGSFFFTDQLGIDLSYSSGEVEAISSEVNDSLVLYDYTRITAGIMMRFIIPIKSHLAFSINLSGGINKTTLDLDSEYKDLIVESWASEGYSVTFNSSSATGTGWYSRIGFYFYFHRNFFVGTGIMYSYHNVKFTGASEKFDGGVVVVPFSVGVSF